MLYSWRIVPLVVFVGACFFLARGLQLEPQKIPLAQINRPLPAFRIPVLGEKSEWLSAKDFAGTVILLNVWASWCSACAEEQLFLRQLQQEGIPIYGLNYKDHPEAALEWLIEWGNPYQRIGRDLLGQTAINLGVYGAPETFLVDKLGIIRYRHVGVIDKQAWEQTLRPLYNYFKEN